MAAEASFKDWLILKLQDMDFDEDVFADYILSILTADEPMDEKRENLEGILSGAASSEEMSFCDEICNEWIKNGKGAEEPEVRENEEENLHVKLVDMLEKQAHSVITVSKSSSTERQLKEAILAQYAQVSDDEELQRPFEEVRISSGSSSAIPENSNASAVVNAEKELREKSKTESEKKKAQDKLNKEKQKQKQQERREKERKRTQKGERRR